MDLHFTPITDENRRQAEALALLPEQDGFVETVAECLTEADGDGRWRPVGIWDGSRLVGFAMYGRFEEYETPRVWMDRLLIDRNYQHRGYGKAALQALLPRLRREYGDRDIYLSVYDDNGPAIHLYRELGFDFIGELDVHGEKVMRATLP